MSDNYFEEQGYDGIDYTTKALPGAKHPAGYSPVK
jgi:hypothetical protein